jgi:hypothetical protein
MASVDEPRAAADPVVDAYKRDVDTTLLDRNLRLTHSERLEQLQRFVEFLAEVRRAGQSLRDRNARQTD